MNPVSDAYYEDIEPGDEVIVHTLIGVDIRGVVLKIRIGGNFPFLVKLTENPYEMVGIFARHEVRKVDVNNS